MKRYVGTRDEDGLKVMVVDGDSIKPLRHVVVHSPSGFECGYSGSGPADLALSILADFTGEADRLPKKAFEDYHSDVANLVSRTKAWRYHQQFKRSVIAGLTQEPGSKWSIPADVVEEYLRLIKGVGEEAH